MSKTKLKIYKNHDGSVTIIGPGFTTRIVKKWLTFEKRAEVVKWAILAEGVYYSQKIEKMVKKALK